MEINNTKIEDLLIIKPAVFHDGRGYFLESYQEKRYKDSGVSLPMVQDNISRSKKGTIRGLHYQTGEFAQGKLCQVLLGKVLDVAVDIRWGSPTFGKHVSVELSDENNLQFWIPPGFAHGFSVLSDEAVFAYKCTAPYCKSAERSIIFNDADLAIEWQVNEPLLSAKDFESIKFSEIEKDFVYRK